MTKFDIARTGRRAIYQAQVNIPKFFLRKTTLPWFPGKPLQGRLGHPRVLISRCGQSFSQSYTKFAGVLWPPCFRHSTETTYDLAQSYELTRTYVDVKVTSENACSCKNLNDTEVVAHTRVHELLGRNTRIGGHQVRVEGDTRCRSRHQDDRNSLVHSAIPLVFPKAARW